MIFFQVSSNLDTESLSTYFDAILLSFFPCFSHWGNKLINNEIILSHVKFFVPWDFGKEPAMCTIPQFAWTCCSGLLWTNFSRCPLTKGKKFKIKSDIVLIFSFTRAHSVWEILRTYRKVSFEFTQELWISFFELCCQAKERVGCKRNRALVGWNSSRSLPNFRLPSRGFFTQVTRIKKQGEKNACCIVVHNN